MENNTTAARALACGLFIATVFVSFVWLLVAAYVWVPLHYRLGQIDALNGDIKYELVEQPDGSTQWERISDD